MESMKSEEPRETGEQEEPLHEPHAEPHPPEGAARPAPMAQGEQRQVGQAHPRTRGGEFQERIRRFAQQILSKNKRKR